MGDTIFQIRIELITTKLYGELDGLASVPEVMANKDKLLENTTLTMIKGGNHSQFGYLGKLLTDETPLIDLDEQQRQTSEALIDFLRALRNNKCVA